MRLNKLVAGLAVVGGLFGFTAGLTSGCNADAAFDCHEVCQKYHDCFDDDYDVSACRSRCRANAESDDRYEAKADVCAACIDDKSCTAATFQCAADCAGIVPN